MNLLARIARDPSWSASFSMIVLAASLHVNPARADDYADVNRLLKAGQAAEALNKADQYLAGKPRDPQMRFLKGVILAETGKTSDAVAVFVKLTEEFPELPEPYNNLAVLYAAQSQFDKARVALEMAIRTNPSYATAHENLGDVYAKLASQAYTKALQLDNSNAAVPPKLALIRNLFTTDARSPRGSVPTAAAGASASVAAPAVVQAAPSTPPTPAPAAQSAGSGSKASTPSSATDDRASQEVAQSVESWAKAWSGKDINAYLAAYSNRFDPEGNKSRKSWEQERKLRITSKGSISVDISDLDVRVNGNEATAVFRQRYKSGSLVSNSRKTLQLAKEGGRWMILREYTGG